MINTYFPSLFLPEPISQNAYEQYFWNDNKLVVGIDEVGRGALAGPLVVSAAVLPMHTNAPFLKDSKILTDNQKLYAYKWLCENAMFQSAFLSPWYIDTHGIYQATLEAMKKVYYALQSKTPEISYGAILIDAMPLKLSADKPPTISMIKGESKSQSIAAASIVAKVTRDEIMKRMATYIPGYDFQKNKAYGTAYHCDQLKLMGPSIIHRATFIKNFIQGASHEPVDRQTSLCS